MKSGWILLSVFAISSAGVLIDVILRKQVSAPIKVPVDAEAISLSIEQVHGKDALVIFGPPMNVLPVNQCVGYIKGADGIEFCKLQFPWDGHEGPYVWDWPIVIGQEKFTSSETNLMYLSGGGGKQLLAKIVKNDQGLKLIRVQAP